MDLSGFDPSTMTYLATQMQQPNPVGQDPYQEMLLPAEYNTNHSTYGGYAGYVCALNKFSFLLPATIGGWSQPR